MCPEIVNSIHDVDTGRLISVPLEKDFENYHGTKAYFDICDMAIRAALPLMETYDSAVTKAIRDDVPNMLKQLEDRDLLTSTVQRQSRMVAIFRQFDQINQAASKGDTMAVLAALKGDGIRQVAVSTVRSVSFSRFLEKINHITQITRLSHIRMYTNSLHSALKHRYITQS